MILVETYITLTIQSNTNPIPLCLLEKDLQEKSTKLTEAHENLNKKVKDFNKKSSENKNLVEQLKTALANGNILQSIIEEREKTIDEIQLKLVEMERFEEGSNDIPSPAITTNINKRTQPQGMNTINPF